jgi:hypothetical protein
LHPGGINVVMADATVHFISQSIDRFVFGALSTPLGNETKHDF